MDEENDLHSVGGDVRNLPFSTPENLTGIETAMLLATAFGGAGPKVIEKISKRPEVIATIAPRYVRQDEQMDSWTWRIHFKSNVPATTHLVRMECIQSGVKLSQYISASDVGYRSEDRPVSVESPFIIPGHGEQSLIVRASGVGVRHAIDVAYFMLPLNFPKAFKIESSLAIPANWKP